MASAWGARVLVGMIAGVMGCTAELSPSAMHEHVRAYFEPRGIEPEAVRCAGGLTPQVGSSVVCEALVDGERIELVMEVMSDRGPPVVRPRRDTLVTAEIELEIAQTLRAQGREVSGVHCEGRLWVIVAGAEHRCEVVQGDGRRLAWIGTFTGEGSRHRARIVPLPPEAKGGP